MNSLWRRSRLTWIGAAVLALLPVGWWFSEHHATVATFRQARHYHEIAHQLGGWSCLGVSRPSAFQLERYSPSPLNYGFDRTAAWERVADSIGFAGLVPGPPVSVQSKSRTGGRHLPENEIASAGWFPGPSIKQRDGWWFLYVPYWLIILVFPAMWFCLVLVWQRRKSRISLL